MKTPISRKFNELERDRRKRIEREFSPEQRALPYEQRQALIDKKIMARHEQSPIEVARKEVEEKKRLLAGKKPSEP